MKTNNTYLWRTGIYCCSAITVINLLNASDLPSWANQHSSDSSSPPSAPIPGTIGQAYTPKNPKPSEEEHTILGGRSGGCDNQLVVLAPRKSIGVTVSERPTFMWYVDGESPNKQKFHLFQYNSEGEEKLVFEDDRLSASQSGINSYTLPQDKPALEVGQTYKWIVAQHCENGKFDASNSASIERIKPDRIIANLSNNSLQKAKEYARSGVWYDAMAVVHKTTNAKDKQFQKQLILDLVGLEPDLEVKKESPLGFKISPEKGRSY